MQGATFGVRFSNVLASLLIIALVHLAADYIAPDSYAADRKTPTSSPECPEPAVATVDRYFDNKWNFDRDVAANDYSIYAAASYDTYEPNREKPRAFRVADNDNDLENDPSYGKTGWSFKGRTSYRNGLSYDVYQWSTATTLVTVVAYRGTDGWIGPDLLANTSWLTQWVNPWDQYTRARQDFVGIMAKAKAEAGGKKATFVTTGHSLGGGLALHIAYSFKCTDAVVFNPSFVVRKPLHNRQSPRIIRIYEIADIFERLQAPIVNNEHDAIYRFTISNQPGARYNHSMERIAAGMSRMALICNSTNPRCKLKDGARLSKVLYCDRYLGFRRRMDPEFRAEGTDSEACD